MNTDISEVEYKKFGIKTDKLSFSELVEMISQEISRQNPSRAVELAGEHGLSSMAMDEIIREV